MTGYGRSGGTGDVRWPTSPPSPSRSGVPLPWASCGSRSSISHRRATSRWSSPGRAALVFNGEIYNYVELREELRDRGWTFTSTGDSEVLLKGWLEWGEGIFARLNGMWAIAIYDVEQDALILSRDRFGEKPLFWAAWRGGLAFASEVKQLRRFPDCRSSSIRLVPRHTCVRAVPITDRRPGSRGSTRSARHCARRRPDGPRTTRYWDWPPRSLPSSRRSTRMAGSERFADALTRSVQIRLRSDVPVGTSLSAGVDSSAVMAEATALGHTGYHSFTVTSDDPRIDEGPVGRSVRPSHGLDVAPGPGLGKRVRRDLGPPHVAPGEPRADDEPLRPVEGHGSRPRRGGDRPSGWAGGRRDPRRIPQVPGLGVAFPGPIR